MAAISIAINRGTQGVLITDFTIGTSAPTASTDFEFRYNTTDQQSNAVTMLDLHQALLSIRRLLIEGQLQLPAAANNTTPILTEPQI